MILIISYLTVGFLLITAEYIWGFSKTKNNITNGDFFVLVLMWPLNVVYYIILLFIFLHIQYIEFLNKIRKKINRRSS
jgi:hypothetical protein